VDLVLAMTATEKGVVLLAISGIAAPIAGYLFHRSAKSWTSFGQGPLSINAEAPGTPSRSASPSSPADRAVQADEVRQMLETKSERRRQRGETPIDVEAETRRLLAAAERPRGQEGIDEELRAEVRQLVVARNERRIRQGLDPLEVEAETQRQLDDLVGSN
jgi:hypothetical protein